MSSGNRVVHIFKLALVLGASLCLATPATANEDTAYWQNLNVAVKLSPDWRISSETSVRVSDQRGLYQVQETLLLGYKPSKTVTVWAGYVHSPLYNKGNHLVTEHRFRQQVNVDNIAKIGPLTINGRLRLEQRWRDGNADTGWRLRPSLRGVMPLAGKVNLIAAHESFFNLNTTAFQSRTGHDRMRNSVAIGVPLSKKFNLELGYMNQRAFVAGGADNVDHIINTTIAASF